ncbi:MAG: hypothetical protein R3F59_32485 [Myxococcota bacterium]
MSDWEAFERALETPEGRSELLWAEGRPRFVLTARQFDRPWVDRLFATATALRRLDRTDAGRARLRAALADRRLFLLFAQPSTRTCESFAAAAHKLGATVRVVSDLSASSFSKGESVEDGLRTLATFFDGLVVRHPDPTFAVQAAFAMSRSPWPMPIVAAGSGTREHPTQALLDLYTLLERLEGRGGLAGKRLLLIGDLGRNRAARSLLDLLVHYELGGLELVSHPDHPLQEDVLQAYRAAGVPVASHRTVAAAVAAVGPALDIVYVTRLQQEWDRAPGSLGTASDYVLEPAYRERLRDDLLILHPLPRVNELPTAWDDHPGFLGWRQMRNGLWVRAALLAHVYGVEGALTGSGRT